VLDRWLEPVVGRSTAMLAGPAHEGGAEHANELWLIIAAVAIAAVGIMIAVARLKPSRLVPKDQYPAEEGFERVLANKFYVDEAYDAAIVRPTLLASDAVLYRGLDVGIIDRIFVVGLGWQLPRFIAAVGSSLQSGKLGAYAWVLMIGVVLVLGLFTFR
jgi:NADH-quinone oxidoreductase subunit L